MPQIQRTHPLPEDGGYKEIFLAGGCFWGLEKYMEGVHGVVETDVGYANGHTPNPTYEAVCAHGTGYAETVRVLYDPKLVSLRFLLTLYVQPIDPVSHDRQGNDIGNQYRSGVYYTDESDIPTIEAFINALQQEYEEPIAIEVEPLESYYLAEDYHQKYLQKNPAGYCHISSGACQAAHAAREYEKPDDETLRRQLSDLQYRVTQESATEPAYANEYHDLYAPGIYVDITTGEPLFLSTDKFESGCGWPAFSKPIDDSLIAERTDTTHGMQRTEVRSEHGDAHLGHVFEDGPKALGGLRYCINSASLRFVPKAEMEAEGYGDLVPFVK